MFLKPVSFVCLTGDEEDRNEWAVFPTGDQKPEKVAIIQSRWIVAAAKAPPASNQQSVCETEAALIWGREKKIKKYSRLISKNKKLCGTDNLKK